MQTCSITNITTTNAARFYSVGGARVFKSISKKVGWVSTLNGSLGHHVDDAVDVLRVCCSGITMPWMSSTASLTNVDRSVSPVKTLLDALELGEESYDLLRAEGKQEDICKDAAIGEYDKNLLPESNSFVLARQCPSIHKQ